MSAHGRHETIHDRVAHARVELSAELVLVGLGLLAALTFALLFAQDPMIHDAMHNFRHVAGVTCH